MAGDLARQELLQLEDAAYAYRDEGGKLRIHQAVSTTDAGAASGALPTVIQTNLTHDQEEDLVRALQS